MAIQYTNNNQTQPHKPTDVICTVIGVVFALGMFVASFLVRDGQKFREHFAGYYQQGKGGICEQRVLFYKDYADLEQYQCLDKCPNQYINLGGICLPESDTIRDKYISNPQFTTMLAGRNFKYVLLYISIVAFSFGLFRIVFVITCPKSSVKIDFFLSIVLLIAIGVLILVLFDSFWWQNPGLKITVAVLCFILAFAIASMYCIYNNQIKLQGIFLDYAVSTLNQVKSLYLYIPIFLAFTTGLFTLFIWQHYCFVSKYATSHDVFDLNNSGVWGVLNILEFIWGLQFLRDAFNFIISGKMINLYWKQSNKTNICSSFRNLLCYHFGSVVFGSFLNAFFTIPCIIIDIFRCHPGTCCNKAGGTCESLFLSNLLDLVRTDTYSYINYSGFDLCASSKQCRKICNNSTIIIGMQSPLRHYRLTAHICSVALIFIMAWFVQRTKMEFYGVWNYGIIVVLALAIITWFINIFSDAAEGLQTCYFIERQLQPKFQRMQNIHPEYRQDLEHRQKRIKKDGNC